MRLEDSTCCRDSGCLWLDGSLKRLFDKFPVWVVGNTGGLKILHSSLVLKKAFYICGVFRANNTCSGISTRVCFINVTVAAGMKPNHLFENITVKNTNRSVRSTVTTKLKEELKSRVAARRWKWSPTPRPRRGHRPPGGTLTSWLGGWLVESYAEYHFWYAGRTNLHQNAVFGKAKTVFGRQKDPLDETRKESQV